MVSEEIRQRPLEKGSGPLELSPKEKGSFYTFFSRRPQWKKKFIL
jgi:hypothetical protein